MIILAASTFISLFYYLIAPLLTVALAGLMAWLAARPYIRDHQQQQAQRKAEEDRMRLLWFGQEINYEKGIWKRVPGLDERLDNLERRIKFHLGDCYVDGGSGYESLSEVVKLLRDALTAHIQDKNIHRGPTDG